MRYDFGNIVAEESRDDYLADYLLEQGYETDEVARYEVRSYPLDRNFGDYHLMVYCNDAEGNESYVARSIAITKDAEEHHHE